MKYKILSVLAGIGIAWGVVGIFAGLIMAVPAVSRWFGIAPEDLIFAAIITAFAGVWGFFQVWPWTKE